MAVAGYTWHVGTLIDGLIQSSLPVASSTWATVMDDADALSVVLALGDPAVAALHPYVLAEPARCFLAVAYTDTNGVETFLAAGPIWTHDYDDTTDQLTIGAAGLWSYFDHRKTLAYADVGVDIGGTSLTFAGVSLGTIAKRLVQQTGVYPPSLLPVIVLPDDLAGASTLTVPGADLAWCGDLLRNLTAVENGPEIRFTPRRKAADPRYLEWVMTVGTTLAPLLTQAGDDWVWDASTPNSAVVGAPVQRDGSGVASRAWVKGSGTDTTTITGRADDLTLTDAGYPLLEVEETGHESAINVSTVDGWARAALLRSQRPVQTWAVKVRRDEDPVVSQYLPGHWVSFTVGAGSPYLPPGTYRTRITGISGDDTGIVGLQFAPVQAILDTSGFTSPSPPPGEVTPPVNIGAPTVTGSPVVGNALTTSTGTWTESPTDYAYQWLRADGAIAGATASSYVVVTADVGAAITVTVTATNSAGSASATSAAVTVSTGVTAPTNTAVPAITGTAVVGNVLTASPGTWAGSSATYAYQWKRAGVAISGATSPSYTVVSADVGQALTVAVTATNTAGSASATSAALTGASAVIAPTNTAVPAITGTATTGSTLTASQGTWANTPTSYTYQWRRAGTAISGATSTTYTVASADVGQALTVAVTATNTAGSATAVSTAVTGSTAAPTNTTAPAITGTAITGSTLTASQGTWANTPTSYAYQWRRAGTAISGATASTYLLVTADVGTAVTVTVTATNTAGSASATSASVTPTAPVVPTLRGTSSATNGATASTSIGVAVPAAAQAGDLAILLITGQEDTPAPTYGRTFTALGLGTAASRSNLSIIVARKVLTSADLSQTVTTTFSTSKIRAATMLVFANTGAVDVATGNGGWTGSTAAVAPSVTVAANDVLVVAYAQQSSSLATFSTPAGFTAGPTSGPSAPLGSTIATFYDLDAGAAGATGTTGSTVTSGSGNGVGLTVAIRKGP